MKKYDFSLSYADCTLIEFALGLYVDDCDELLAKDANEHVLSARQRAFVLRQRFKNYVTY